MRVASTDLVRHRCAALLAMLYCGCIPQAVVGAYVARRASEDTGLFGWFRAGRTADGTYSGGYQRVGDRLDEVGCADLGRGQGEGGQPIYVLVHGVGGEGLEMQRTSALLMAARPASIFAFRWVPWNEREALVSELSGGLSRLAWCGNAERRIVVIAHSAGGVLASLAVGHVVPPRGVHDGWLMLLTVSAPLAGTLSGPLRERDPELLFFFDLGSAQPYSKPAAGVRVLHLRTQAPADREMAPMLGHVPNDAGVGVPGALQVDLRRP
jgi:hypothetical protein